MVEYECPECGEAMESPDVMTGEREMCSSCNTMVLVPGKEESPPPSPHTTRRVGIRPKESLLFQILGILAIILGGMIIWVGGLALHCWTAYLFFEHWGIFWAFAAFCMPFLAEAAVFIACFSWGMWFYSLAIATWIVGGICFSFATSEDWPRVALIFFIATILLLCGFVYFAVDHAVSPQPISENRQKELGDIASAICVVFSSSRLDDAANAVRLVEAKTDIQKFLGKCTENEKDVIRKQVDTYLIFDYMFSEDLAEYMIDKMNGIDRKFVLSEPVIEIMKSLPEKIRVKFGSVDAIQQSMTNKGNQINSDEVEHLSTREKRQRIVAGLDMRFQNDMVVYKDLFGRPMPTIKELRKTSNIPGL